ncbi:MAG: hypothetical protein M3Z04_25010, partial [Chloroflexota bacterium]|nr:hypothetical protein [Chloroflexota bacterium]
AAPRRKRRRADSNRLIYQILTLTIGLVLVISTVASVYGSIANTGTAGVIATVPPTSDVTSLVNNGASFEQKKQYQFAEQFYLQALQTEPQNLSAMVGLARVYRDEQPAQPAKAQQYAQQAVQIGGTSPQASEAAGILAQLAAPAGSPAATSAATTPAAAGTVPAAATPAP